MKSIVLTGGHAGTTAIALAEELNKFQKTSRSDLDIYWIGSVSSVEGKKLKPIEFGVLPKLGVKIKTIIAGRLQRKFTIWTIPSLFKIPVGVLNAFLLLMKIKPAVIVSFGGYAAFPVVLAGFILRIKVILHEQTMVAGRANIYSSYFATKVALGRRESMKFFPKRKTVVTGNPVMTNVLQSKPRSKLGSPPTILVTLGSRGSQRINKVIGDSLIRLLNDFKLIHITGASDFNRFLEFKNSLDKKLSDKYEIHNTVDPLLIGKTYEKSDIVIGRSGANTVSELMVLKIPSILIPIPFTYLNEQLKNARYAQDFGIALVIEEKDLNAEKLIETVHKLTNNWQLIKTKVKEKENPDLGGSHRLLSLILEFL